MYKDEKTNARLKEIINQSVELLEFGSFGHIKTLMEEAVQLIEEQKQTK